MTTSRRSTREPSVPRAIKSHALRAVGRAKTPLKKKPYKISFEEVTAPKRKLKWDETSGQVAPPGYIFVPYGSPAFTECCRQMCTSRDLMVYVVKAEDTFSRDPSRVSNHTHRVGYHFPSNVVVDACYELNFEYDKEEGLFLPRPALRPSPQRSPGLMHYSSVEAGSEAIDETETYEDRVAAIRENFPNIPDADVRSIMEHTFKEGTQRVGNAEDMPLSRRVQLAVVAHIRHVYTDYDKLLKSKRYDYIQVRNMVAKDTIAMMRKFRDEEENDDDQESEDILREVLIIEDDDDDGEYGDEPDSSDTDEAGEELQLVATPRRAQELEADDLEDVRWPANPGALHREEGKTFLLRPIYELYDHGYHRPQGVQSGISYHTDVDGAYVYVPRSARYYHDERPYHAPATQYPPGSPPSYHDERPHHAPTARYPPRSPPSYHHEPVQNAPAARYPPRSPPHYHHVPAAQATFVRDADGIVYKLRPIVEEEVAEEDVALPSVEPEFIDLTGSSPPPTRKRVRRF